MRPAGGWLGEAMAVMSSEFKFARTGFGIAVALAVMFAVGPAAAQDSQSGGTMVFATEQEQGTFNFLHPAGQSQGTAEVAGLLNRGTYQFPPDGRIIPLLISKEAEVTTDPFTVTYTIRDDAKWNDGQPLLAEDYAFTYETIVNPKWTIANRKPYDLITGYQILGPKVIRFTFKAPVPTYKLMFPAILPKHALDGANWDTVWRDRETVSNGPFKFDSWNKGQQVVFVKNPYYFDGGPKLDRIVMRFVPETNTLLELFRSGEIDASDPQPQPEIIQQTRSMPGIKVDAKTGLLAEYLRFSFKTPGLDKPFVRHAILMGIDRNAIVEQLMHPVDPKAVPPQSWVFGPGNPNFQPKYDSLAYNPDGAIKLLESNGCKRGGDGVFVCGGARLEYRYVSTAGNERRQLAFEIIQAFLGQIGIKVNADFSPAAVQFGERGPKGDYDLFNQGALFDDPVPFGPYFRCDGNLNKSGYCNHQLDTLMDQITVTADPAKHAALLNEYDRIIADDLPLFPVYGLPRMSVYNSTRVGGFNTSQNTDSGVAAGGMYWSWNAEQIYRVH